MTLAGLRGMVVLLGFVDPACARQCQPIGREIERADSMLGANAARVALVGMDLSGTHRSAGDLRAYDRRNGLGAVPTWHFLTGTLTQLRQVWRAYGFSRPGRPPGASGGGPPPSGVVFVIGQDGRVRG